MTKEIQTTQKSSESSAIEAALMQGNLAGLNPKERLSYYQNICASLGLNALTKPFEYMTLNGKLVLYATKGCAEQLRHIHKVALRITAREKIDDVYVVTAEASLPDGRVDSSTGAVTIANVKGEALANAFMKAETKAKRRVTLSLLGLNMLDDSEVESIKDVTPSPETNTGTRKDPNPIDEVIRFGDHKDKTWRSVADKNPEECIKWMRSLIEWENKKPDHQYKKKNIQLYAAVEQYASELISNMEGVGAPQQEQAPDEIPF